MTHFNIYWLLILLPVALLLLLVYLLYELVTGKGMDKKETSDGAFASAHKIYWKGGVVTVLPVFDEDDALVVMAEKAGDVSSDDEREDCLKELLEQLTRREKEFASEKEVFAVKKLKDGIETALSYRRNNKSIKSVFRMIMKQIHYFVK